MSDKNYCYIEDGVVKQIQPLPKNWANVSGFNKLTDLAVLKSHGWLPFEEVNLSYNSTTHYRDDYIKDIQSDKVVYTDNVVAFTAEQLAQNAMNDWKSKIEVNDNFVLDGMPRVVEDLMDALNTFNPEILNGLPRDSDGVSITEEKLKAKKAHRDSKPA